MKNIFRAAAQNSTILKSIQVLMLVLLVTFGVTSCKNQTEATSLTRSEVASEPTLPNVTTQVGTENLPMEIGTNPGIENRRLCIGGSGGGQERRNLAIGGNQTVPRSLSEIGGQETSRRLVDIGGQGCPRQFSEIGGNQTANRVYADIGGNGGTAPRALHKINPNTIQIGGNSVPRSLLI